ncbi:MAG: DedA family protein [Spirochaetes bacterium]|nr:DedA family protein [Spirochaetota bacterium]
MFDVKDILIGMAPYAHYLSFGLLLLAGLSIPVSEDLIFIISASIAATIVPQNTHKIFIGCFIGAYMSDMIAYSVGRYGISWIMHSKLMTSLKIINPEKLESRIDMVHDYFLKYGGKTIFFGRFVPFGLRNVIFMTCGIIEMNLVKFMLIDLLALTCTSFILFSLGYAFGNNYETIFPYLKRYKFVIFGIFIVLVLLIVRMKKLSGQRSKEAGVIQTVSGPKNGIN